MYNLHCLRAYFFFPSFFALIVDFLFTLCLLTNYSNIVFVVVISSSFFSIIVSQFFGSSSCALERICLVFFSVIKTKWKRVFRVGKIDRLDSSSCRWQSQWQKISPIKSHSQNPYMSYILVGKFKLFKVQNLARLRTQFRPKQFEFILRRMRLFWQFVNNVNYRWKGYFLRWVGIEYNWC